MNLESCPICGWFRTSFSDSFSDGSECVERPLHLQECANRKCGLPCKFWRGIKDMIAMLKDEDAMSLVDGKWVWGNGESVFGKEVQ